MNYGRAVTIFRMSEYRQRIDVLSAQYRSQRTTKSAYNRLIRLLQSDKCLKTEK